MCVDQLILKLRREEEENAWGESVGFWGVSIWKENWILEEREEVTKDLGGVIEGGGGGLVGDGGGVVGEGGGSDVGDAAEEEAIHICVRHSGSTVNSSSFRGIRRGQSSLLIPYENALLSLLPEVQLPNSGKGNFLFRPVNSVMVSKSVLVNAPGLTDTNLFVGTGKEAENSNVAGEIGNDDESIENDLPLDEEILEADPEHVEDENLDNGEILEADPEHVEDESLDNDLPSVISIAMDESFAQENAKNGKHSSTSLEKDHKTRHAFYVQSIVEPRDAASTDNILEADTSMMQDKVLAIGTGTDSPLVGSLPVDSSINDTFLKKPVSDLSTPISSKAPNKSTVGEHIKLHLKDESHMLLQSDLANSNNDSAMLNNRVKKEMRCNMPPKSITSIYDMERLLVRHRASSRAMRPRWSSVRDQEILSAKLQIQSTSISKNDREIYAPLFRNVSMFKRSYKLMERILKVYIYKEGEKPIFHQPMLKGLYASEGWFMKLMEGNKRFVVKDPRKAHLFYMPFSSRSLQYTLYVRNSHNRTNLRQYLKNYTDKISAKYPFFNRTGGADHFLVACHDWAPYETRHHMERCMKALCNADVTAGFKIGRDVSLPETYVRSARNPLRDLGGKPPSERHILAFYAGNMHGYLRPILLNKQDELHPPHEEQQVLPLP
ncbi:uncharacterized protein LOC132278115 [Cornus florida]|uniref:uncharacterized protein LOC132278115 n=1 Tax=Cornus florida TaxID=4283 RepID=UPI00289AABB1|nr:uncharacterized protein LOC132278115 [Cornus florida]